MSNRVGIFAALLVLAQAGCGGAAANNFTGPSSVGGKTTITILSGEDGKPVPDAKVVYNSQSYTTDGAGTVAIEGLSPKAPIDISANNFVTCNTVYENNAINLLPNRPGFDLEYWKQLVYGGNELNPLFRVTNPSGVAVLFDSTANRPAIIEAHRKAAEIVAAANDNKVRITVIGDQNQGSMLPMKIEILPALLPTPSAYIVSATYGTIDYGNETYAGSVVQAVHELARIQGLLGDVPGRPGVMQPPWSVNTTEFSPEEKLAIRLVAMRPVGNRFPDIHPDRK
jgi:hypothetical protein